MNPPGFYKMNYRALRIGELIRAHGWRRLPLMYLIMRFKVAGHINWMPALWSDTACLRTDLSERCFQALDNPLRAFQREGFFECGFTSVPKRFMGLNPFQYDVGGVRLLDRTRCYFGAIMYVRACGLNGVETESLAIGISAAFDEGSLTCSYSNAKLKFDPLPHERLIRAKTDDVTLIYRRLLEELEGGRERPRRFSGDAALQRWFDDNQQRRIDNWVRRGLVVRMSDDEVEAARRKLAHASDTRTA